MDDTRETRPTGVPAITVAGRVRPTQAAPPKIWQINYIALVAIRFTALFWAINGLLQKTVWPTDFVTTRRWTIPVGVVLFSLLVGLIRKYLHAPTVIHGTVADATITAGHDCHFVVQQHSSPPQTSGRTSANWLDQPTSFI